MTNAEIADHFSLLAQLMDLHGENAFKSKSYSSAAYGIERLTRELSTMEDAAMAAARLGYSARAKIHELLLGGKMEALEKLIAATPPGLMEMMQIKGLGPKKIRIIWQDLGIETVGELEYACTENRLAGLKGFGEKTQQNVCESISFWRKNQGWHLWAEVESFSQSLIGHFKKELPKARFELTGEIRRQVETLEIIELVTDADKSKLEKVINAWEGAILSEEPNERLLIEVPDQPTIRIHLATADTFFHTLFLSTGSAEFLAAFLKKHKVPDAPTSEQEIFKEAGIQYVPPALRELPAVLERAEANELKELVTAKDIRGIIHSHSTWSDGADSIEVMAKGARDAGFEYLVISDHSQAAQYAGGLTPDRIAAQHREIEELNAKLAPFKIFKSIEADILGDGSLDYNERVLSTFDIVIASVHSNLKMSQERAMERLLTAIRNPYTSILGHMTGRLLLSREGYPVDHKKLIDTCAAYDVVIEINAHPKRLDMDWRWMHYAIEKGVLLSINPDAHAVSGFKDVHYGSLIAQKGGVTPEHNLSSFRLGQFEEFVKAQQQKRGKQ
jgi:DNA polymerase (family 10)